MDNKEEFIDYLQTTDAGNGFQNLSDHIINKDVCVFCGACVSLCPRIGVKDEKPVLIDSCPECSLFLISFLRLLFLFLKDQLY
ncbi:unnamed protein product [marine sediment metagenome]|uniref:4Fe-4S ferredoxin-type domain-containing protein n=1 Tax=marine sediment metagenome TaxID=412755 RepID=X1T410_9ZZZZ